MTKEEQRHYNAILKACKNAQDAVNDSGGRMTQLRYLLAGIKRTKLGTDIAKHQREKQNARIGKSVLPPDPRPLNSTPVMQEDIVPEVKPKRKRAPRKKKAQ